MAGGTVDKGGLRLSCPTGATSPGVAASVIFGNAKVYFEVPFHPPPPLPPLPRLPSNPAFVRAPANPAPPRQTVVPTAEGVARVGLCQSTADVQKLQAGGLKVAGEGARDGQTAWTVGLGEGGEIPFPEEGVPEGGMRVGVAYAPLPPPRFAPACS